jgi:hypothetical protein
VVLGLFEQLRCLCRHKPKSCVYAGFFLIVTRIMQRYCNTSLMPSIAFLTAGTPASSEENLNAF